MHFKESPQLLYWDKSGCVLQGQVEKFSTLIPRTGWMTILLYLVYLRVGLMVFLFHWFSRYQWEGNSRRREANHVLVFSTCAFSNLRAAFVCKAFLHYGCFMSLFLYIFLVCSICQLNRNKQIIINKTNTMLNGLLIKYLIWINFVFQKN